MNNLLIVDGHNLLFQMFFGMPSSIINKEGKAIQGTMGFVGGLLKMIEMVEPTHVLVLFDGERGSDRTNIDPNYKANRPDFTKVPEEENPFSQLDDIYKALDCMSIKHIETCGVETDDVVASYVMHLEEQMQAVIVSSDTDFYQLVNEQVSVLCYRGKKSILYTPQLIADKYGIQSGYFADFKCLVGDHSDNIKGIQGVGPKIASILINELGGIESILEHVECITKPKVKVAVIEHAERLRNNYAMIKLNDSAEMPFVIEELIFHKRPMKTNDILRAVGLK